MREHSAAYNEVRDDMPVQSVLSDPTGAIRAVDSVRLAPRPADFRGLTLGLLDNTKVNAARLLEHLGEELQRSHGVERVVHYTKDYFGTPLSDELRQRVADECDLVITGVGDCGSCSAATVADGILLEQAGIPSVSIISDSFQMSAQAMAAVHGFPDFAFTMIQHPLASLDENEISARAQTVLPRAIAILQMADAS